MRETLLIQGKRFQLTLQAADAGWQWMLVAAGEVVLSGEATSSAAAKRDARRAGLVWARARARAKPPALAAAAAD